MPRTRRIISTPKFLDRKLASDFAKAIPAVQQETARHLQAGAMFLDIARSSKKAPSDPGEHYLATDILSRDIRAYTASLMKEDLPYEQLDLIASLIEEADFTAALTELMHQVARRVRREKFSSPAQAIVDVALSKLDASLREIIAGLWHCRPAMPAGHVNLPEVEELRGRTLALGPECRRGRTRHDPGAAGFNRACRNPDPPHRCRTQIRQPAEGAGTRRAKAGAGQAHERKRL